MRYLPFAIGIVEIVLFVAVASWIGVGWTILLALLTSVAGFLALQREGARAWASLRASVGRAPTLDDQEEMREKLAGTGSRMVAAFMLMLPGFLTDVVGALLLIPSVRAAVGQRVAFSALRTFPSRSRGAGFGSPGAGSGGAGSERPGRQQSTGSGSNVVIEGEVVDKQDVDPDGT